MSRLTLVAYATTSWPTNPATRVTWLDVGVIPAKRGQGIGTAMFDRMEALVRDAGRPVVQGGAFHLPTEGPRLESPTGFGAIPREERNARFLLNRGYTLEQVYRYSALYLPVDPVTLERNLSAAAAKAGTDYRRHTWSGSTPERWLDDLAVVFTRLATRRLASCHSLAKGHGNRCLCSNRHWPSKHHAEQKKPRCLVPPGLSIGRKRRGSVARRRYGNGYTIIAQAWPVERVGRSRRAKLATPRAFIAESTRERIRQLSAEGWSLRKIADDVGVSHESVRQVLAAATVGGGG